MALSARSDWTYLATSDIMEVIVSDTVEVFDGALVSLDNSAGELILAGTDVADDVFIGVAIVSDTSGDSVTGNTGNTVTCKVDVGGRTIRSVAVTGVSAETHVGDAVWASDDQTLTLSAASSGNRVGVVTKWYSGTTCDVALKNGIDNLMDPLS